MKYKLIIPAIGKNKYNENGDLAKWGGTTLLEWKISHAKKVKNVDEILISTNSKKITSIVKDYHIKTIFRKNQKNILDLYLSIAKKFRNYYIIWLNCTSPFISEKIINKFLNQFNKKKKLYDTAFLCLQEKEYFMKNKKPINFLLTEKLKQREELTPIYKIVNGASILNPNVILKRKQLIGLKPMFFKINWLESLEIKDTKDIDSYQSLIQYHYSNKT